MRRPGNRFQKLSNLPKSLEPMTTALPRVLTVSPRLIISRRTSPAPHLFTDVSFRLVGARLPTKQIWRLPASWTDSPTFSASYFRGNQFDDVSKKYQNALK